MIQLTPQSRIFVATQPVDFRKGVVFSMWRWTEIDVTLGLDLTASSNKEGP